MIILLCCPFCRGEMQLRLGHVRDSSLVFDAIVHEDEDRGCGMKEFCVSALDRGHSTISRWNDMSGVIQIYGDKYGR
mgnify:CR=1 FL=1